MVKNTTILIVEDDPGLRAALELALTYEGLHVVIASNGREALFRLRNHERPAMILLDLLMPVMDGHEFLEIFEKEPAWASIPVVAMSSPENISELKPKMITMIKPFTLKTLLLILQKEIPEKL